MAGNSAIFKKANKLMREGHSRSQAFKIAYQELGETKRAVRKTVKKNPVRPEWNEFYGDGKKRSYQLITDHLPGGRSMILIDPVHDSRGRFVAYSVKDFGVTKPYWSVHKNFRSIVNAKKFANALLAAAPLKNPAPIKRKTRATTMAKAKAYVRRPSQASGKAPTKRLAVRRTKNLRVSVGVFPNPRKTALKKTYKVQFSDGADPYVWQTKGLFYDAATAKQYALALAKTNAKFAVRVMHA